MAKITPQIQVIYKNLVSPTYIIDLIQYHIVFQMNFNIDIWSSHSNTSEDACLLDTMLHYWASSHIYKDTTGLVYIVKQLKEDPRRLVFSTLMQVTFYVLQLCSVIFASYKLWLW